MILELDRVSKVYATPTETIKAAAEASLSIDEREVLVLFGPSGSGKSTLLLLAAGARAPDSGSVRFRGHDISALSQAELSKHLREHVGVAYQEPHLLDGFDALSNVAMKLLSGPASVKAARRAAFPVLSSTGMSERASHLPSELSGGERQRVALARAMLGDPDLLLLDEPTANLDSKRAGEILDLIAAAAAAGAAVLLVTHDRAAERIATRTVELVDGHLHGQNEARAA